MGNKEIRSWGVEEMRSKELKKTKEQIDCGAPL